MAGGAKRRRGARAQFTGGRTRARDRRRGSRRALVDRRGGDFRHAARQLCATSIRLVAIVTLAFGIGGNTAIFTIVDSLLRGLPYRSRTA
jgi:hypothetical protein